MYLHFCWARCQQTGRFWWSATGGPAPDVASLLSGLKLRCSLHGSQLQRPSLGLGSDSPVRCKAAERDSVHGKRGKQRAALTKCKFNRPVLWTLWASSCLWSSHRWCLALTGWSFCYQNNHDILSLHVNIKVSFLFSSSGSRDHLAFLILLLSCVQYLLYNVWQHDADSCLHFLGITALSVMRHLSYVHFR